MSMRVPFLADEKIESAAHELLMKFSKATGKAVTPPIPVDDIIEKYLRVRLEICDLKAKLRTPDVLGAAYFEENIIRVDESLEAQEGRLCFTMAHEAGHWQLHRPLYEMDKVSAPLFGPNEPAPTFLCRSSQRPPAEIQADKFAAKLLMPTRFVREAFSFISSNGPALVEGLDSRRTDPSVVNRWSDIARAVITKGDFSNVSVEAMRYRLTDLSLVLDKDAASAQRRLL